LSTLRKLTIHDGQFTGPDNINPQSAISSSPHEDTIRIANLPPHDLERNSSTQGMLQPVELPQKSNGR
jgi:hypothetical protein